MRRLMVVALVLAAGLGPAAGGRAQAGEAVLCPKADECLSPQLVAAIKAPPWKGDKDSYRLSVFVTKLDEKIADAIKGVVGGTIEYRSTELNHLIVLAPSLKDVRQLTQVPGVFHVGWIGSRADLPAPTSKASVTEGDAFKSNQSASEMHFINEVRKNYARGDGEIVGVWDHRCIFNDHVQLRGRVSPGSAPCKLTAPEYGDHATHIAGTIGSAGTATGTSDVKLHARRSLGMAPGVHLVSYLYTEVAWTHELATWSDKISHKSLSAISNHSWGELAGWAGVDWYGDPTHGEALDFGRYEENTHLIDALMWRNRLSIVITATGNDRGESPKTCFPDCKPAPGLLKPGADGDLSGYDTLGPWSTSKNAIVVGARDSLNFRASGKDTICTRLTDRSSWGPTDDGRIKPDVVATGAFIVSTTYKPGGGKNVYEEKSGTSMAAPVVTGLAALLSELYRKTHEGSAMRSDELRALLIHTADDGSRELKLKPGSKDKYDHGLFSPAPHFAKPTYCAGWGSVNGLRAAHVLKGISDDGSKGANSYLFRVPEHTGRFEKRMRLSKFGEEHGVRITLAWTDPPGKINNSGKVDEPAKTLVNDLELVLKAPSGRVHFPWRLDPAKPAAEATHCQPSQTIDAACRNKADNVEVVDVAKTVVDVDKGPNADGEWIVEVEIPPNVTQSFALVTYGLACLPADTSCR